jgi:hypothetical protein
LGWARFRLVVLYFLLVRVDVLYDIGGRWAFRESRMTGPVNALLFILGIVLMIVGLVAIQYGLVLYGDKSNGEVLHTFDSPYNNFLFTYIPEYTLFSAMCIFFLGLLLLLRATGDKHQFSP